MHESLATFGSPKRGYSSFVTRNGVSPFYEANRISHGLAGVPGAHELLVQTPTRTNVMPSAGPAGI